MSNANVLLNKATDNTKITAQTLQTVSISALKYANEKFKNTPALLPINNFNIKLTEYNDISSFSKSFSINSSFLLGFLLIRTTKPIFLVNPI